MSDHDFEKQVQLKLEQLKLRPSTAVWAEVERNIRLQKRRRRMLIWLPAALLVLVAGGYLALKPTAHRADLQTAQQSSTPASPNYTPSNQNSTPVTETSPSVKPTTQPSNDQAGSNKQLTGDQPVTAQEKAAEAPASTTIAADKKNKPVTTPTITPQIVSSKRERAIDHKEPQDKPVTKKKRRPELTKPARNNQEAAGLAALDPVSIPAAAGTQATTAAGTSVAAQSTTDSSANTVTQADSALAQLTMVDSSGVDTAQALAVVTPVKKAAQKNSSTLRNKVNNSSEKESKWQFGAQAEGGLSGITKDGFMGFLRNEAAVADLASNSFSNSLVGTTAIQFPRPDTKASELSMGPAFSIGGFAQRKLSKRISLSAGLQYTYLSARQVVGTRVNNNRTVNRVPATSQMVSYYYNGNNTEEYTNRFHFIEIPVTLHTQLNKGERLPIGWDLGFSVSRLLSTNALHYDGIGSVYYKDDALFQKVQWAASTGFNVKLFHESSHPASVGPVMRFNLSSLLEKEFSTGNGRHLWAVGLRANVLLKK